LAFLKNSNSLAERASATAGALSVRVFKLKPCSVKSGHIINNGTTEVASTHWIYDNLNTMEVESEVTHALLFVEIETILVARATATNYGDTEEITRLTLFLKSLSYSLYC